MSKVFSVQFSVFSFRHPVLVPSPCLRVFASSREIFFAFLALVFAATAAPADPLIVLPEGDFSCEVEVAVHDAPKPDPAFPERRYVPVLKNISITRVGQVRRDMMKWSDGSVSELWSLPDKDMALFEGRGWDGNTVLLLRGDYRKGASPQLLNLDKASVAWITVNALGKPSEEDGAPIHYKVRVKVQEAMGDMPAVTAIYQAWVDPETRMPLKFDDGTALYTLKFSETPPAGPLVMPGKFKEELDLWLEASRPAPHR